MRSFVALWLLMFALWIPIAHSGEISIGYTNVELVLMYMPETRQMEQNLQTYEQRLQQQFQTKQDYYQNKLSEYLEKQQMGLSPDDERSLAVELTSLDNEIQQFAAEAEQKLVDKRGELMKPIVEKLQQAIDDVAKEKGYDYVLNQSNSGGVSLLLYGPSENDITEDLMKKLGIAIP
ncbi:MAG: OmpH family outer membrane protein [Proteobacteria bacterium]|nr:OmpH family outer membrane protein [Pseudomonadota bacterium]